MQIGNNLWLESAYYVDIDWIGQLRIAGPNNHLYFGSVGLNPPQDYIINNVKSSKSGELVIEGRFNKPKFVLHDPAIGPMLQIRTLIEPPNKPKPSFAEVMRKHPDAVLPHYVSGEQTENGFEISYRRFYSNDWYGVRLIFPKGTIAHRSRSRNSYQISHPGGKPIEFRLKTETKNPPHAAIKKIVANPKLNTSLLGPSQSRIDQLLERLNFEVDFLIRNNRTSGFDYGTVFPRDWMEAADLGEGDILKPAAVYMYGRALELVSSQGLGWHENIVGELEAEKVRQTRDFSASLEELIERESRLGNLMQEMIQRVQEMYIIRNMIDIEPHYILGLQRLSLKDFSAKDRDRIRLAGKYLVTQAEKNKLITFKKIPDIFRRHKKDVYYGAGNWRDSTQAFKMVHPVIAPYDVNAVFYPEALKIIKQHAKFFGESADKLELLIERWSKVKDLFRFTNADGTPAYALALYDVKQENDLEFRRLEVNHTDEAYGLFYGHPDEADVVSFCKRLQDAKYFYTPVGPTIVGAGDGYSTLQYHGKVIWTKQTAFVVAGLARLLKEGRYSPKTRELMTQALIVTGQASVNAIHELNAATELHYAKAGKARFYNEQKKAEGPMNKVQLWSAIGARSIIRNCLWAIENLPSC